MIFSYSLSFPFESFHLRNMTDASTLAGLKVFGSFNKLTTDNKIVLKNRVKEKVKNLYMTITLLFKTLESSCRHLSTFVTFFVPH